MKEQTIETFLFDELDEDAKEEALKWGREVEINTDYDWHEYTTGDKEAELIAMGFENAKISFSGFWSQGDGACFDADINWLKFVKYFKLEEKYKDLIDYVYNTDETGDLQCLFSICKNSYANHYSHERTRYVQFEELEKIYDNDEELEKYNKAEVLAEELEKELEQERLDQSREIYKELNKEYDALNEDESIAETLRCNEYEFTKDGKRYKY